jgi:L-asparaginase
MMEENPISEVCIFFRDYLFRGNRARKLNSTNYFGFSSPNYLPLAEAGTQITSL